MFLSVEIENFKSLSYLFLDFYKNKTKKEAKNLISIYGENGSGKSNIIDLLTLIPKSVKTVEAFNDFNEIRNQVDKMDTSDSKIDTSNMKEIFKRTTKLFAFSSLPMIIKDYKTIGSEGNMKLKYTFLVNNQEGDYYVEFNDSNRLVYERLDYLVGKRKGKIYEIKLNGNEIISEFSPTIFKSNSIKKSLSTEVDKLWSRHSFLSILDSYSENINTEFIDKNIGSNIFDVIKFFTRINFSDSQIIQAVLPNKIVPDFESGIIDLEDEQILENTEELVYEYLTALYSDIKDAKYITEKTKDKINYELYVTKLIDNELIKIPFRLESKGTKKILDLLPLIINIVNGDITIIDEIDEGIHDLLIKGLVENIFEENLGQIIFTTHNTYLMKNIPKQNMYVINSDSEGRKTVSSLNEFDIKSNNNIQNMYLNGAFGGTPYPSSIDFVEILEDLDD